VRALRRPLLGGFARSRRLAAANEELARELAAARGRFAAAFASSPLGTALTDLDGTVQEANRLLPGLTNTRPQDIIGTCVDALFDDERTHEDAGLRAALLAGHGASYQLERRLRRIGATCWVQVSVALVQDDAGPCGFLFQLEDVTHRKLAEQRAQHLALHDALTHLPNRLLLLDRMQQALSHASRSGRGVGALFIDLDRFKLINDTHGHEAGDVVLAEVAHRLRRCARAGDTVARLGGDEFIVVCPDVGSERDVLQVAAVLREAVAHPIEIPGGQAVVDASIGIAFGVGHDDPEVLLRQADQAMYRAKDRGRARYEVFDDDLRSHVNDRLDTELCLRGATERGELETWYQPIISLCSGEVVANEALARWRRPGRGVIDPVDFIQVAEEAGLIRELGSTVLRQACTTTAKERGHAVSVNVSPRQFVRADFQRLVEETLALTGLAPDRLWLELTERAVVDAIDYAARSFQSLRDSGVRIAIDDFGTGFSSFAHLKGFTVDLVKVDRAFVRDLMESEHDQALVEGMIEMAHALHMEVVAEGVETTAQRDLLRQLGCGYAQGFLFAEPSPVVVPRVRSLAPVPKPRAQDEALAPEGRERHSG
jgi:diguanylate cyclase (GGDEF)-like protein/PAS domain S-box-containing protein